MRMHDDQVDVTVEVVAALVAAQFPQWCELPIRPVASHGTVNALFRLGGQFVLRFPLVLDPGNRAELEAEHDNARRLAGQLPVAVPEPVAIGEPGAGYPGPWSVSIWIDGETADEASIADPVRFARDLAGVVQAVRRMDTRGCRWAGVGRGGPLAEHDDQVRLWLDDATKLVDVSRLGLLWRRCVEAPPTVDDTWIHADLMPGNLLLRDARLAAVLDLGTLRIGDPAVDLMPAWNLFDAAARATYRRALDVDDATWLRGCGWALMQGVGAIAYYVDTNPMMAAIGRRTLAALLAEHG